MTVGTRDRAGTCWLQCPHRAPVHIGADGGREGRADREALCQRAGVRNELFLCYQVLHKTSRNPKLLNSNLLI